MNAEGYIDIKTEHGPRAEHRVVMENVLGRPLERGETVHLGAWVAEAAIEAGNDDALLGVVVHKRHGVAEPGRQWVTLTVDDFAALLTGQRVGHRQDVVGP